VADGKKARLFVTDNQSRVTSSGFAANKNGGAAGVTHGAARRQTPVMLKTSGAECPEVTVAMNKELAHCNVLPERGAGKGLAKDNTFALFNKNGDPVANGSTRALSDAVRDGCTALVRDWSN
jgi:hypothetical protein